MGKENEPDPGNLLQLLTQDSATIKDHWCEGSFATDNTGRTVHWTSEQATHWDIKGVIYRHENTDYTDYALQLLELSCYALYGTVAITTINDRIGKSGVSRLFDLAVQLSAVYTPELHRSIEKNAQE